MKETSATAQKVYRRPLVVYLFLWITLGFYGIYWYMRTVEFLNSVDRKNHQNIRIAKSFVIVFLSIYFAGFLISVSIESVRGGVQLRHPAFEAIFFVLFLMALSWNVLVPFVVVRLAVRLRRIQVEYGIDRPASPWLTLLAYCFWFVAFPYLQHHLNLVAEAKIDASVQV